MYDKSKKKSQHYSVAGCDALTTLNIPNAKTVALAGEDASEDLESLIETVLGVKVGCKTLTTLDMPKVTNIGKKAFKGFLALETVTMPNIATVGVDAFKDCIFKYE